MVRMSSLVEFDSLFFLVYWWVGDLGGMWIGSSFNVVGFVGL